MVLYIYYLPFIICNFYIITLLRSFMKLLTEVYDFSELERLKLLFEQNGILIFVANEDAARNFSFIHPAGKYALHVIYEEQYEDVIQLLQDENHIVNNKVDIESYQQELNKNKNRLFWKILDNGLLILIFIILIIFVLIFIS